MGHPIAAKGFRPFFLLAAAFVAVALPLWVLALQGWVDPGRYLDATSWHAHEMIFGFAVAVIAGFLLTAVGNWTTRETLVGGPLLGLSTLWVVGRVAILAGPAPRWLVATADLLFIPVLTVVLARPLVRARNWRNLPFLGMLTCLFIANLAIHLDVLGVLPGWRRRASLIAVDVVVLVILMISGRVVPMFTRNATGVKAIRSMPALDTLTMVAMGGLVGLDVWRPDDWGTTVVAGLAGVLAAARTARWGARHSFRVPLLWILHVGHAWIPLGLVLRGSRAFSTAVPSSIATHALTVGAIGALTLAMMARVALGHSGRPLAASRSMVAAFALVTAAAFVRVLGPLITPADYRVIVVVSGAMWSVSFAMFLLVYAPILSAARVDGKPG